ncbi:MAG: DUF2892 domain-containing protein [Chloroflexi bacterium]|nr:DUF2892 domain-containing protein [Chloroflexota bacterium]MBI3169012.1 DUF2892 domain-containing protein [Chloroflexota bacterium]
MKRNMSNIDRVVRLVISTVFVYLYVSGVVSGALGVVLLVFAAVFTLTAVIAFCPLYAPFKFSTFKS